MMPRKSDIFLIITVLLFLLFGLMPLHASLRQRSDAVLTGERRELVQRLGLTDLCIFTEARYTRHPSLADLGSAFQDHPSSLEHFPSGSLIAPPEHIGESPWRVR